jgi:hypothetical protein
MTVLKSALAVLAVLTATASASASALGQGVNRPYAALPDWSGLWQMNGNTVFDHATVEPANGGAGVANVREHPPYNAEWEAKYQSNIKKIAADRWPDPLTFCGVPAGFPRALNVPDTYEFVLRPEQAWILTENGPNVVRIYTDGRKHPPADEVWDTYSGDSVGHWDGDILEFDTIAMRGEGSTIIDRTGVIHSNGLHVVTRMHKVDANTMEAQMTLDDPVAFTRPWTVTKRYRKLPPGTRAYDYACSENNRNLVAPSGKTLTLGSDGKPIDKDQQ